MTLTPLFVAVFDVGPVEYAGIDLRHDVTVLYGRNGAGKSTILRAVASLTSVRSAKEFLERSGGGAILLFVRVEASADRQQGPLNMNPDDGIKGFAHVIGRWGDVPTWIERIRSEDADELLTTIEDIRRGATREPEQHLFDEIQLSRWGSSIPEGSIYEDWRYGEDPVSLSGEQFGVLVEMLIDEALEDQTNARETAHLLTDERVVSILITADGPFVATAHSEPVGACLPPTLELDFGLRSRSLATALVNDQPATKREFRLLESILGEPLVQRCGRPPFEIGVRLFRVERESDFDRELLNVELIGTVVEDRQRYPRELLNLEVNDQAHVARVPDEVSAEVERIQRTATDFLRLVLPEAPELQHGLLPISEWFGRGRPKWRAVDGQSRRTLDLDKLSSAEQRWATVATRLAEHTPGESATLLLIDEPEMALHPRAISRLPEALRKLAGDSQARFVTASHSPVLLGDRQNRVLEVRRIAESGAVAVPTSSLRDRLDELGLSTGDVLLASRGFLLVEGAHEQWLLDELIGDILARLGVTVVALHGTKHTPTELIFELGEQPIAILLDDLTLGDEEAWREIRDTPHDLSERVEHLTRDFAGEKTGVALFRKLARTAIERGVVDRFHLIAMPLPDLVFALPPRHFGLDDGWAEVRGKYEQLPRATRKTDFEPRGGWKTWVSESVLQPRGFQPINEATIRSAARELGDELPQFVRRILEVFSERG